jgi:hypothetical protein
MRQYLTDKEYQDALANPANIWDNLPAEVRDFHWRNLPLWGDRADLAYGWFLNQQGTADRKELEAFLKEHFTK